MCFNFFGIKIYISFLFCITVLSFLIIDKSGLVFLVLFSSILHEAGHIVALCIFKNPPKEVNFLLGGIEFKTILLQNTKKNILVSLSGPIVNLMLFAVFYKLSINFAVINLLLGVFNLLPFCGLDGATVLTELFKNNSISKKIISILTVSFSAILFFIIMFIKNFDNKASLIILSVYFLVFGVLNYS